MTLTLYLATSLVAGALYAALGYRRHDLRARQRQRDAERRGVADVGVKVGVTHNGRGNK